jgi:hypothetical protein
LFPRHGFPGSLFQVLSFLDDAGFNWDEICGLLAIGCSQMFFYLALVSSSESSTSVTLEGLEMSPQDMSPDGTMLAYARRQAAGKLPVNRRKKGGKTREDLLDS